MKRSKTIQLTIVSAVAAGLLSCGERPTRYCVDEDQRVIDENNCVAGHSGGGHFYYGRSGFGSGVRVTGGSTSVPSEGFTTPSGTVRGGFGAAGEAHGVGGGE